MLNDLKLLLGFAAEETDKDELLRKIISMTTARLRLLLGGAEPPEEMNHIILDVSASRFNRIGSEGMASHNVEGESLQFSEDDFAQFKDEIQDWLSRQSASSKGRLRFI